MNLESSDRAPRRGRVAERLRSARSARRPHPGVYAVVVAVVVAVLSALLPTSGAASAAERSGRADAADRPSATQAPAEGAEGVGGAEGAEGAEGIEGAKKRKRKWGTTVIDSPVTGSTFTPTNRAQLRISGRSWGKVKAKRVRISIRNLGTGHWRQDNGTFSARRDFRHAQGTGRWSFEVVLPPGRYSIQARSDRGRRKLDRTVAVRFNVTGRDPLRWPYPSNSFWNTPRGTSATLVPFGMKAPAEKTLRVEDDLLFMDPTLPTSQWTSIAPHSAGWKLNGDRCDANWNNTVPLGTTDAFPLRPLSDGDQFGIVPNHSAAIVMPDYTLRETQPLTECKDGFASQYASGKWQGDSLLTGGMGPNAANTSGGGSHGGSFMTAFGGTIRLGEWVRGGNIPHATKIEIFSRMWLTRDTALFKGYRWPALAADAGWAYGYGAAAPTPRSPHAVMGALLTLPNTFNVSALTTEPAQILARSIQDYGTYIVDGTGRDTVQVATEWSSRGRVTDEFRKEFGFSIDGDKAAATGAQAAFLADMERIFVNLAIVTDNGPSKVGGAGARRTYSAPPLR
ncbi:hypothetical protein [Nocardioides sp. GXZ039]|uniref:hypothetical protein n=1 Tax=Nocardioides sp. GXZ039 TaxID=3136018 RepID=UPI0030F4AE52